MAGIQAKLSSQQKVSLNWIHLNAIVEGVSAIDLGALALRNIRDARQFAMEYGFNIENAKEMERINRAHREALEFIEQVFLEVDQRKLIPREVAEPEDVLQLLVYASQHIEETDPKRIWSCAVLKVMHGIFHIDNDLKLRHFNIIRRQIFESLDKVIVVDNDQFFLSDGDACFPLYFYEKKRNKGRKSILLKLLQKASYVAADIYDHLGVRLIFNTRFECLMALKILRRAHLISVTNVKPHRTRNTLIDLKAAKRVFIKYRALLNRSENYPAELFQRMDQELLAESDVVSQADNPHSSSNYQSIQITVRKMIHVPNPAFSRGGIENAWDESGNLDAELSKYDSYDSTISFFFDYEIQIMDKASYLSTMVGPASHEAYKQRQVETARTRVFGKELLTWINRQESDYASQ